MKTFPFALNEKYYGNSESIKLLTPTQDSWDIINAAVNCLDAIWVDVHRYQKAGIILGDFYSQVVAQLNLFDDNAPRQNSEKLMEVLDHLNAKDGRGTLYFAGQGIQAPYMRCHDRLHRQDRKDNLHGSLTGRSVRTYQPPVVRLKV
ncbi:hypothetical protein YA24_09905 [Klebsiella aerogenes]|nr:hypothetical protein YA24_09905 [Klebsiella aerogenes]